MKSVSSREEIKKISENTIEPCDCKTKTVIVNQIRTNSDYIYFIGILYIILFLAVMVSGR